MQYRRTVFSYIWDLSVLGVIIGYASDAIGMKDMSANDAKSLCV